jgi:antitoxin CptB
MNELELLKNKIKYRSMYRGTKEMDLLLSSFVNYYINNLNGVELIQLENFINCDDFEILNLYRNNIPIKSFTDEKIISIFKKFKI